MTSPNDIDLEEAALTYSVANTPLYLVRKLRSDPAVSEIASRYSGEQILLALQESVVDDPLSPQQSVRPYAYLVALSFKSSLEDLRTASEIIAPHWDWYHYVAEYLIQNYHPILIQSISSPPRYEPNLVSIRPEAEAEASTIIVSAV